MTRTLLVLAAIAAMLGLGAAPAFAQARVFVSGFGSDANPCSLSAPCRSFQQAHDTVLPGGEIVALDAAGYGRLSISKAVTVTAIGIEASMTSDAGSRALTINAGASDVVSIRGLTLIAGSSSSNGVTITSAKSVTISDTSISGFLGDGIVVGPTNADIDVELRGVTATGSRGTAGLSIQPAGSGNVTVLVTDSSFNGNNNTGIQISDQSATGTIKATLNAAATANGSGGILALGLSGQAPVVVMVTGSKLVNNTGFGLLGTGPTVTMYVDRTQISGNTGSGWSADSGAVVKSYTNNEVNGNASDALNGVTQITSE